ncbi:MAG: siroheme synthase CysG [bacterium]|nr:uroporphyrinogen-III C-methyltransferase [Gammaproteobacteria bacterium]HIL96165.1 uroporphyrinogen-III C-methyltransferase [Pseudomonadales bacterium]
MDYLPLFFNLADRKCLIIGGGEVAFRKAELVSQAGANLKVVAPVVCEALNALLDVGTHQRQIRKFEPADLDDVCLVVCATSDTKVNRNVSALAKERLIPVNVVDSAQLSTVIFPSIIDRSPVIIAATSGGHSPVLARKIREILEATIPQGFANLASFLGKKRSELKARFPDPEIRRRVTEAFLSSPGEAFAQQGKEEQATEYFNQALNQDLGDLSTGEVYLVGAGPGDPDLLTLRALQLMQKADVVLYDNLVSDPVLARVRRDARRLYVGKKGRGDSTAQESINEILLRLAKEGHRVLRLKGGDPFIFGRGGEEIESLMAESVSFQVVPGITAASGCAAYAGIPLTHRDYSQSVRFVTGHPHDGVVDLEWREFSHKNQTIVFYMGLGGLKSICEQLIAHGRAASTPIAVISKGTTPEQKTVVGDLESIPELVEQQQITAPTLIIVGEVVALRKVIGWD